LVRTVAKAFLSKFVLPDRSKSGMVLIFEENRREDFVRNKAKPRNWQGECFSRGRHNNVMEITAAVSSRTKGKLNACR